MLAIIVIIRVTVTAKTKVFSSTITTTKAVMNAQLTATHI